MNRLISFAIVVAMATSTSAYIFKLGDCPDHPTKEDFTWEQFEGSWYVLQKFNAVSRCIRENVTRDGDNYLIKSELESLGVPIVQPATVKFFKNRPESMMRIQFPKNYQLSDQNYWVIDTDYRHYALVWSCYNTLLGHRESAQIMSRSPKLDREYMDIVRSRVKELNIDDEFTKVPQTNCRSWDDDGRAVIQFNKRHQAAR